MIWRRENPSFRITLKDSKSDNRTWVVFYDVFSTRWIDNVQLDKSKKGD